MASFTANPWSSPCIGTLATTDGFYNEQPVPEEYFFASTLPHNGSTVLQEEIAFSTPARSTGMLPGSSTGLVSGVIGLGRNVNRSFDMVESPYPMWLSDNQPVLMGQTPCGLDAYSLTHSFYVPGSFPSTFDPYGYAASSRDMWTKASTSSQNNSASTLNAQIAFSESLPFGQSVQRGVVSENDEQQTIDVGFDIPDLPQALYEPTISPTTDLQSSSEDRAWSLMRAPLYGLNDLSQNSGNPDLGAAIVGILPQAHQNNEAFGLTSPESYHSLAIKRASSQSESVATASPPKRTRMKSGHRAIVSKSTASADIIKDIGSDSITPQGPKKGCRNGPLTPETREHACKMRIRGACAPCHRSHIKCDLVRPICKNCEKKYARRTLRFGCNLGPLQEYTGAFIPDLVTAGLTKCAVEKWIKEKHIVFTAHTMKVSVSLDPFGIVMSLPVHEIYSADQDYLKVPVLTTETRENRQFFATRPSLQYGIYDRPIEYLKQIYFEYINEVSNCSIDAVDGITGDTLGIIWKVLGAIQRFAQTNPEVKKNSLVPKAINVFWMHYLMGRSLVLSDDSARKAIESLQNSTAVLPPQPFVSAGLVSRQMKVVMKHSLEDAMQDLLIEVDKELKRDWKSWAVCFCAVLILCILVEQVQAATDAVVTDEVSREGQDAAEIRKIGIKACQDLEGPINYAWDRFQKIQGKHNPVKNGYPISPQKQEAELIREIRDILTNDADDVSERAKHTCLGGFSDTPTDHNKFYMRISAQYVSKFLRFFC